MMFRGVPGVLMWTSGAFRGFLLDFRGVLGCFEAFQMYSRGSKGISKESSSAFFDSGSQGIVWEFWNVLSKQRGLPFGTLLKLPKSLYIPLKVA